MDKRAIDLPVRDVGSHTVPRGVNMVRPICRVAANGFEGAFEALSIQATGLPVVFDFTFVRNGSRCDAGIAA